MTRKTDETRKTRSVARLSLEQLLFETAIGNRIVAELETRFNAAIIQDDDGQWRLVNADELGQLRVGAVLPADGQPQETLTPVTA